MGSEILAMFVFLPLLFWVWNVGHIILDVDRELHTLLLCWGALFLAYWAYPFADQEAVFQGLMIGGLLYLPLYAVSSLFFRVANVLPRQKTGRFQRALASARSAFSPDKI